MSKKPTGASQKGSFCAFLKFLDMFYSIFINQKTWNVSFRFSSPFLPEKTPPSDELTPSKLRFLKPLFALYEAHGLLLCGPLQFAFKPVGETRLTQAAVGFGILESWSGNRRSEFRNLL